MWKSLLRRFGFGTETTTPISKLIPGQSFCIEGIAIGIPGPHLAPFTGVPAATMSIEQEELRDPGEALYGSYGRSWVLVNDIDFGQTFYVRDDTGIVRVDRQGWSRLRARRQKARRLPNRRLDESLVRFQSAYAGDPSLRVLESVGLDRHVSDVRCWETVVPDQARVRVSGEVRSTSDPLPTGAAFPLQPATFREAPRLLELVPGQDRLVIRVVR